MTGKQFYDWQTRGGKDDVMQSKRIKDLADIARLLEAHPHLRDLLTDDLKRQLQRSEST